MKTLLLFLEKDCRLLTRKGEMLVVGFSLSLLFSILAVQFTKSAFLSPREAGKILPALLWFIFLLAVTFSIERLYEEDFRERAIEAVKLLTRSLAPFYIAKVLIASTYSLAIYSLSFLLVSQLSGLPLGPFTAHVLPAALVSFGFGSLSVLLSVMTYTSRLRIVLLPLLLTPLSLPLLFSGVELTLGIQESGGVDLGSFWLSFGAALDCLYFALGILLFDYAAK